MAKLSIKSKEFSDMLINKQLEKYGVTMQDIPEDGSVEGEVWYQYYTFDSKEEYESWKNFCVESMMNSKEKLSKAKAAREFAWFNLSFGLKQNYL